MSNTLRASPARLRPFIPSRTLTDRPAGPGGLFRSVFRIVNPSARAAAASRSRLRQLRASLEERSRPAELSTPAAFENETELRDFVEMRIQESMRDGQFDNLKNKGRPLPGPHAASALDVAMRIMRENGIRPYWLQLMHDIDGEKRIIRRQLQFAWHRYMPQQPDRWEGTLRVAEMRFEEVNRAVDTFNLVRPMCVKHLFRLRLRMPEEVKRAMESEVPETLARKQEGGEEKDEGSDEGRRDAMDEQDGEKRGDEPRPSWQLFARFVRAAEVREYERPTWGRRRITDEDSAPKR